MAWFPERLWTSFPRGSCGSPRFPLARSAHDLRKPSASFTRFEALIPLRIRSRRRRPGCPGVSPGSPRDLLETTPCGVAPSSPPVDALLGFAPPEAPSRLGP